MLTAALYKDDAFDNVHACQKIFRTLMMALAFPGTIYRLESIHLANIALKYSFALQPFIALLDLETRHHVYCAAAHLKEQCDIYLETNTGSRSCPPESADFILCLESSAQPVFAALNRGTLDSPDRGATLLYHVEAITSENDENDDGSNTFFSLKGPGIQDDRSLSVSGLARGEPALWQASRLEYPLGIDIFLVSRAGDVVGVPRSVSIRQTRVN